MQATFRQLSYGIMCPMEQLIRNAHQPELPCNRILNFLEFRGQIIFWFLLSACSGMIDRIK